MEATREVAGSNQKAKQENSNANGTGKTFERIFKGHRKVIHDLFELKRAIFKQNVSYKFFSPQIVEIEHKHFFHSVDRKGLPNNVSSDNSGHFHYVELSADKDGKMKVKCGPAMRKITKKVKGKERDVVEPVFYGAEDINEIDPQTGKRVAIIDDHTHELEYVSAEELSL